MSDGTMTEIQRTVAATIPDYLSDATRLAVSSNVIYALADAGFETKRKVPGPVPNAIHKAMAEAGWTPNMIGAAMDAAAAQSGRGPS